jgi:hypothetical protein
MLSYFTWKREIADIVLAFTQLIEHLADAERTGGFELARGLLKRVGRNHRDHEVPDERVAIVTMPLPTHDFDVAISKSRQGDCRVAIAGLRRYAGFSLSCALPPRDLRFDLSTNPAHRVTWRARKLFSGLRQDQRAAG